MLILLDFTVPGGLALVTARLLDTLVGCVIVLVFGYLLWPQTWRASLGQALHSTVLALDAFVGAAVTEAVIGIESGTPAPEPAQVAVLRRAIRHLDDEVSAQRSPDDDEVLADGALAPSAREVDTARRLVREAASGHRTPVA